MNLRFPLKDVKLQIATQKKVVKAPLFDDGFFRLNQNEFSITVEGVASYYVADGKDIEIHPEEGASREMVEVFLNNWGTVGILHQRKILNFHASAFQWHGNGMMVCGDSGAGKSSLTAAFCLEDARFISDDITLVTFLGEQAMIQTIPTRIALKEETVKQLNLQQHKPIAINPINEKRLFELNSAGNSNVPLKQIIWLNKHNKSTIEFAELDRIERFTLLRGEICGWEMLNGMKETEINYLEQLLKISRDISVVKVTRPENLQIAALISAVRNYLGAGRYNLSNPTM